MAQQHQHQGRCKLCGGTFWESYQGARGEDICDGCESRERIAKIAKPYIETGKPGDVLNYGPCDNPKGWFTVYRNERPIHHLSDEDDAYALVRAIENGAPA